MLIYSVVRPFSSISSKLFLMFGSSLGLLSVTDLSYINNIAELMGIQGGAKDLYLYISFLTIFLFIIYATERVRNLEKKIIKLTRQISLNSVNKNK